VTGADELQTARLLLRRWQARDEGAMAAINQDPDVTRYLNRPVDAAATAAFFALVQEHWDQHGFGFYALESREPESTGRFIGFVGVAYPTFLPELATRPELGWRLARHAWGRGLATEAAQIVRDHAFDTLGLPELISIVHPDNARSQRVAAKLGMTIVQRVHSPALSRDVDVWQLTPPDQAPSSSPRSSA
jgi:RimJ/RimL family protein N-acetyltransferase